MLLDLAGMSDIPGLHCLFWNVKAFNWSVKMLLSKMEMALKGMYRPRNYSKLEIDLATTIYKLGGVRATPTIC
ncbi:hypothetical protein L208DRAFT_1498841 [Tricholoma matsutake]|nr:hypothetical protein L208DRAFT_1498841 [Tricholoma matsutake 945]